MNDIAMMFALALASNQNPEYYFECAFRQIKFLGETQFSPIYLIPCRDGVGADYWNAACIVQSDLTVEQMIKFLKNMEFESGRVRPSHQISLDVDLIAWGANLSSMQFNVNKLPLAVDVKIPLYDIWADEQFKVSLNYPVVEQLV